MGIETFIDDNRDGIADVFVDDYDGVGGMQMEISRSFFNATVFAADNGADYILDPNTNDLVGVSMTANGYVFKMFGPMAAASVADPTDISIVTGSIRAAYVYDQASISASNPNGELVASSESLGIEFADLYNYFMVRGINGDVGAPDGSALQTIAQLFGGAVTVSDEVVSGAAVAVSGDGTMTETYKTEDGLWSQRLRELIT